MSLIHEDDVDWFLTMDETHHLFSTVGAKGGATAGRYTNHRSLDRGNDALRVAFTRQECMALPFEVNPCHPCIF
jgi:hypothetical protein